VVVRQARHDQKQAGSLRKDLNFTGLNLVQKAEISLCEQKDGVWSINVINVHSQMLVSYTFLMVQNLVYSSTPHFR